jgi:hypothetical protein
MGGHINSYFHLKLIENMSLYLNFRAQKGSISKTFTVFEIALMVLKVPLRANTNVKTVFSNFQNDRSGFLGCP